MGGSNDHSHGEYHSHKKTYLMVFLLLFVLTVVEIFIPGWDVSSKLKTSLITLIALVKAFFVAYIFMHLNEETKWMKFIAAIPICAAFYTLMVAVESITR